MVSAADNPRPRIRAHYFAKGGNKDDHQRNDQQLGLEQIEDIDLETRHRKKDGRKNGQSDAFEFVVNRSGQTGHLPKQDAHHKSTQDRLQIQGLGNCAPCKHQNDHQG